MKKVFMNTALLLATTAVLLTSCKKKKDDDSTPDYSVTSETNSSQDDWDDILKVTEQALRDQNEYQGAKIAAPSCGGYTLATNQITIDYGTSGCVGADGRTRKGQLIITYTGPYMTAGSVITTTTNNYYVNGKKIEGRRTVTSNGNSSGNYKFTVKDSGEDGTGYSKITQVDGGVATWKSTRTRTWIAGSSTPLTIYDDQWTINGTAEGVSSKGVAYTMVASDIKIKCSCWVAYIFAPVSGTLSLTAADGTRSVDYGTGDCDKTVVYTNTNGKTYTISWY